MGIFSRFTDIINSNINALLDKAEDPEKMVRLIIQEMEDTLVEVRTASASTIARQKELQRHVEKNQQDVQAWESKAGLAISRDREDLARAALSEKNKIEQWIAEEQKQLTEISASLDKLHADTAQLEQKLSDAKARQKTLVTRHQNAAAQIKVRDRIYTHRGDKAFAKFERYEHRLDRLEASVESYDIGRKNSLHEEFSALENNERIEAELMKLKQRTQPPKP